MPLIEIPIELDEIYVEKILYKIPFISPEILEARYTNTSLQIVIGPQFDFARSRQQILKMVEHLVEETRKLRVFKSKIRRESRIKGSVFRENIFGQLVERGEVVPYGMGLICYSGTFLKLIKKIDAKFQSYCEARQAEVWEFPEFLMMDDAYRIKYLNHYPHQALTISHVRENIETIEALSSHSPETSKNIPPAYLSEPEYLLRHALCIHFYRINENTTARLTPCRIATTIGKCNRYESKNMRTFERLCQFTMREIIYMGSSEIVNQERNLLMDFTCDLAEQLDLEYQLMTSNDPFFASELENKALFQHVAETKYELVLPIDKKNKIAAASFNYHGTNFSDTFHIGSQETEQRIHTACFGYGLERLAFAFLTQHGLFSGEWPRPVREFLEW